MSSELAARPDWQRGARLRLIAATALAAVLTGAFIVLTDFAADEAPIEEIAVTLLAPRPPEPMPPPEEELQPLIVEETPRELPMLADFARPAVAEAPPVEPEPVLHDWYTVMDEVVADVVAGTRATDSVNPVFDAQRRRAAGQFRPSRAPVERPVWENVETDQLGRKILVSGDCQRVIDDPNVGSNEIFRTFGQYIVSCSNYQRPGQELPWVDEIRDRRVYLQSDPEAGGAARSAVVADLR